MARRKAFTLSTIGILLFAAFAYVDTEDNKEKATVDLPKEIAGKDGAPMLLIPAGEFQMGSDDAFKERNLRIRDRVSTNLVCHAIQY
jgi:formylglycine-generating enzyme required for sulfatase activity